MDTESGGKLPLVKSTLAVALAAAFSVTPAGVDAAGLGRLTVQSGLGQPLEAQVEVTALTREEASSLSARLASPDAFADAGLEFNPALTGLRFEIQQRPGATPVVAIRSLRPINEPFIDLLIELNWATGKFVREYTFLLDPPELQLGRAAPQELSQPIVPAVGSTAPSAPLAAQTQTQAQPQPAAAPAAAPAAGGSPVQQAQPGAALQAAVPQPPAAEQPVAAPRRLAPLTPPPQATPAQAPSQRTVERGDTLAEIAESVRPVDVTLDQAIVAIYRANPDAFFGSVHQMRAGATLTIPGAIDMAGVTQDAARDEIARSNQVFREYRARIAEQAREASSLAANEAQPAATAAVGQIGEAPAPIVETKPVGDQLELSRNAPVEETAGQSPTASTGDSNAEAAEGAIARDIALRNAQQRVTELERNVADLQRLLELKNKQLADFSQQAPAAQAGADPNAFAPSAPATPNDAGEPLEAAPVTAEATAQAGEAAPAGMAEAAADAAPTADTATAQAGSDAGPDVASGDSAAADDNGLSTRAESAVELARQASDADAPPVPTQAAQTAQPQVPAQPESMLDTVRKQVLGNPYVPAGVAVLLGLIGLFVWKRRRSSDDTQDSLEDTLGSDEAFTSNSLFGTTGGQDVDTNQSLFQTAAADSEAGVDVHSTEVDPIAEAEVYIAYGREAQAEEILKEALKRQPDRQAIRLKLLEIYAGRKDATTYAQLAREMYDQTGGQNEEWPKVITMGLAIDPDNPLYTGEGDASGGSQAAAGAAAAIGGAALASNLDTSNRQDASLADADAAVDELEGALSRVTGDESEPSLGDADFRDSLQSSHTLGSASLGDDSISGASIGGQLESVDSQLDTVGSDTLAASEDELGALDFNLDTEAEVTGDTVGELSSDSALGSDSLDMPGLSLDLDDDGGSSGQASAVQARSSAGTEALSEDISDLGLDIPSIDTLSGASAEAGDVDLSSIGLDLSPATEADSAPEQSDSARWQEMATKLDLASAYEEIGDREGARELLDEVVKGGDNAQQQKARAMLSKMS